MQYILTQEEMDHIINNGNKDYELLSKSVLENSKELLKELCPRVAQGWEYCDDCPALSLFNIHRTGNKAFCFLPKKFSC